MKKMAIAPIVASLALGGLIGGLQPAASADGTPASNQGCPAGYTAMTLAQWAALGYTKAPAFVDSPAHGGNGDGIVCGHLIGKTDSGGPLYVFTDNDVKG